MRNGTKKAKTLKQDGWKVIGSTGSTAQQLKQIKRQRNRVDK